MKTVADKLVLVTGAASGIGYEIARAFAGQGARVVLADVDAEMCETAAERITTIGGNAVAIQLDVTDPQAWVSALGQMDASHGPIDILCNNAGVGHASKKLTELDLADWQFISSVNVGGVLNGIRHVVPAMLDRDADCHVVNTSSILGHFALGGAGDYVATKYAVLGLSETLRMELAGRRVGVSVLCPGLVNTQLRETTRKYKARTSFDADDETEVHSKPQNGIAADLVGAIVVESVLANRFYIFTHPEYLNIVEKRYAGLRRELASARQIGERDDTSYLGAGVIATL